MEAPAEPQGENSGGLIIRMVVTDITERKRLERALRRSEETNRLTIETLEDVIGRLSPDMVFTYISPSVKRLTGYEPHEIIGCQLWRFCVPSSLELVRKRFDVRMRILGDDKTLEKTSYEVELIRKDGTTVWVDVVSQPSFNSAGRLTDFLIVARDVTERKVAADALRASEERFRRMFENHSAIMILVEPVTGRIIDANRAGERFYGYTTSQLRLMCIQEINILPPDEVEKERILALKELRNFFVFPHRLANGEVRTVEVHSAPIEQTGNHLLFSVIHDITERKQMEEALRSSTHKLNERVKELACLYSVSKLVEEDISLDETFLGVVDLIPQSWQYPEIACARGILRDLECKTENYKAPVSKQAADIIAHGERIGFLEVGYLEESPQSFDGPFQKEERNLINAIAERIGRTVERKAAEEWLRKAKEELETKVAERTADLLESNERLAVQLAETRRAEEFLRESEQFLRQSEKIARIGGWTANPFINSLHWTEGVYDIVEAPKDYQPGLDDGLEFYTPPYRPIIKEALAKTLEHGAPFSVEAEVVTTGGKHLWTEVRGLMRVEEGEEPQVIGSFQDITERKLAEDSLRESERRFRLLLEDVSSVAVQGYDTARAVVFWNSASERLYGYSRDEALGKQLEDLIVPPSMREGVISAVDNWVNNGQKISAGELGLLCKDGSIVQVYSSHVLLDAPNGEKEMYCVDLDLSDLKKAEEERITLRDQLFQSQKMEAVGNLAGGIAHDFNNILQVVLGFSQVLLQQKKEGEADYSRIEKIYNAGQRGADLVKNLMMFSRHSEPVFLPTNLNHEVLQVRDLLSQTIPKTINVDINLEEDLKSIQADRSQLGQILMNLAVNARDAMPNGGTLRIETANVELDKEYCSDHIGAKPGSHILLTVSDTGQGMDKETLAHIFEPFFTTKEVGKGTGLGLATVHGIVNLHGGHMECYSEICQGATFKVYFPAIQTEQDMEAPTSETPIPGGTETVLLVDDDDAVRDWCQELLGSFGYEVITAGNGKEAVEMCQTMGDSISLVILDLIMPVMDGRQCLAEILRIKPSAKVIIASGYSESGPTSRSMTGGAKGFVEKPYNESQLLTTIRKVLDQD